MCGYLQVQRQICTVLLLKTKNTDPLEFRFLAYGYCLFEINISGVMHMKKKTTF